MKLLSEIGQQLFKRTTDEKSHDQGPRGRDFLKAVFSELDAQMPNGVFLFGISNLVGESWFDQHLVVEMITPVGNMRVCARLDFFLNGMVGADLSWQLRADKLVLSSGKKQVSDFNPSLRSFADMQLKSIPDINASLASSVVTEHLESIGLNKDGAVMLSRAMTSSPGYSRAVLLCIDSDREPKMSDEDAVKAVWCMSDLASNAVNGFDDSDDRKEIIPLIKDRYVNSPRLLY